MLNSACCRFPPLIEVFLKSHVLFEDLTVGGKALVILVFGVSRDQPAGRKDTRLADWSSSVAAFFVIIKHANAQYTAHPQTPLPTTKVGS